MQSTQDFTHLILTRFNTAVDFAPPATGLDDAWLKSRLLLFERYCLPTVAAQRHATFKWLVFCDAASPAWFKEKMSSYGDLVSPLYIDGPATDEVIARSVAAAGLVSSSYLITTRLDNDDGLGRDHLRLIQRAFKQQDREFLVFPLGLQLYRGRLYHCYWKSNPFLSLVERVKGDGYFTTVLCVEHDRVRTTGKVRNIISAPQWLQVIHGSNLLNVLRGWPRVSRRALTAFSIPLANEGSDTIATQLRFSTAAFITRGRRLWDKIVKGIRRRSAE
ncbi:MAG TPA: glycosyltransferase [Acidobacteriaceae bacterium]